MVSLMKAFLPGSCASGASKLPRPNSATTPIASFLTAMCAATIWLMPLPIAPKSPSNLAVSMTTSMSPLSCSADMRLISAIRCLKLPRTSSTVSLMKAFLPGNCASGASKLPRPNSATTPIASFLTVICAPTMRLMPSPMARKSPSNLAVSICTSISPLSCSTDMRLISAIRCLKLPRTCSMVSLMKAFLPGSGASGASKLPRPNSATTPSASFLTAMCAPTMRLRPSAMPRKSPWNCALSMTASISPASCWSDIRRISAFSPSRLRRTCSTTSLMNAFWPGNAASGAVKLPRPNSATQSIACLFTPMCPATMLLMRSARSRCVPGQRAGSSATSHAPAACALAMWPTSAWNWRRSACAVRSSCATSLSVAPAGTIRSRSPRTSASSPALARVSARAAASAAQPRKPAQASVAAATRASAVPCASGSSNAVAAAAAGRAMPIAVVVNSVVAIRER